MRLMRVVGLRGCKNTLAHYQLLSLYGKRVNWDLLISPSDRHKAASTFIFKLCLWYLAHVSPIFILFQLWLVVYQLLWEMSWSQAKCYAMLSRWLLTFPAFLCCAGSVHWVTKSFSPKAACWNKHCGLWKQNNETLKRSHDPSRVNLCMASLSLRATPSN